MAWKGETTDVNGPKLLFADVTKNGCPDGFKQPYDVVWLPTCMLPRILRCPPCLVGTVSIIVSLAVAVNGAFCISLDPWNDVKAN